MANSLEYMMLTCALVPINHLIYTTDNQNGAYTLLTLSPTKFGSHRLSLLNLTSVDHSPP